MALDEAWQLAQQGAGRLWLVSWDGRRLALHATWTGATFRSPSSAEQQGAAQGFLDTSGHAWFTADLPRGFYRDAWRQVPGLPPCASPASYAVDGKGRIWVICRGIIARWDGHWASVANHLPGLAVSATSILAAGNGVLITLIPGERVCYME